MLIKTVYGKLISGMMLIAFCAATIIFQNMNLKNYYSTLAQKKSLAQSFNGQLGLLEEEAQSVPNTIMEEEDDDFATESILLVSQRYALLTLQYFLIQEQLFNEHHPEIISPPPQS